MEAVFLFFLFVFVIVIFIILLTFKSSVSFKQKLILRRMDELKNDLNYLKKTGIKIDDSKEEGVIQKDVLLQEPVIKTAEKVPEEIKKEEKVEEPETVDQQEIKEEFKQEEVIKDEKLITEPTTKTVYQQPFVKTKTQPIKKPKKKTDFEKFIGENLLNKIGIVILVLALIFFGKYAVDKGWLNDTAKVVSIVLIGGI